jgi:hypothetical protein
VQITAVVDTDVRSCLPGNHDWLDIRLRFVFIVISLHLFKFERLQRNLHAHHHGDGHFILYHRLDQHDADDRLMPVLQRSGLLAPRENRRRKRTSPLRWAPVEMTNLLGHLAQSIRQRKSPWIECSTVPSVSTGVLDVHALYAERKIRRRAAWPSPSVFPWPEAENRSIDSPSAVVGSEQRHSLLVDSLPTEAPRPPSGLLDPLSRQNPTHNAIWALHAGPRATY